MYHLESFANLYCLQETNSQGIMITDKSCLIMDEVDGMSAGDRGGVGALNALIKKTKVYAEDMLRFSCYSKYWPTDSHNMHCQRPRCAETEATNGNYVQPAFP